MYEKNRISVLTTTYNCGHLLPRVYECLCRQTAFPDEWVVIDDGSNDGTGVLVGQWKKSAPFAIEYQYHENQGMPVSRNAGYALADGDYCFTLDADDEITENCVEIMHKRICQTGKLSESDRIGVIEFLCSDQNGVPVGPDFPREGLPYNLKDLCYRQKMYSERVKLARKEVFKRYRYQEQPRRISSSATEQLWFPVSEEYLFVGYNDRVRIYHRDVDQQMTRKNRKTVLKYAESNLAIARKAFAGDVAKYGMYSPRRFMSYAATAIALGLYLREPPLRFFCTLGIMAKLFYCCCLPFGIYRYLNLRFVKR